MISTIGRKPSCAAPSAVAENRRLRDRRVEDALPAELSVQPPRDPEDAAGDRDVLAEEDHRRASL